jgi:retron-type reverse transcriptase
MKRYGNLYGEIASFASLYEASRLARKGKRGKASCATFEMNIEEELFCLQEELIAKTYRPGPYREFTIYDRKPRKISAAPYRDRVVHHALCRVIEPIFERSFIHDSYACRPGKGTHQAVNRFTEYARRYKYVLKMDIRKYFPSIDHKILHHKISRKIKCRDTLELIELIIDGSNRQEEISVYFPGDGLFTPWERRKGIPIGNLTSQFFANLYLNDLDHYAKETLGCRCYIRYVDDITVFDDDKQRLWDIKSRLAELLAGDRLSLHPDKTFVVPVTEGVDHLGYRIFPTHRRLRQDNVWRFLRKMRRMQGLYAEDKVALDEINTTLKSWLGHARHADTQGLRTRIFTEICFARQDQT